MLQNSKYYRHTNQYKNDNNCIRFYADGQLKEQGFKTAFTVEEMNDNNKGIVGYYLLKGKVVKLQKTAVMQQFSHQRDEAPKINMPKEPVPD